MIEKLSKVDLGSGSEIARRVLSIAPGVNVTAGRKERKNLIQQAKERLSRTKGRLALAAVLTWNNVPGSDIAHSLAESQVEILKEKNFFELEESIAIRGIVHVGAPRAEHERLVFGALNIARGIERSVGQVDIDMREEPVLIRAHRTTSLKEAAFVALGNLAEETADRSPGVRIIAVTPPDHAEAFRIGREEMGGVSISAGLAPDGIAWVSRQAPAPTSDHRLVERVEDMGSVAIASQRSLIGSGERVMAGLYQR